MGILLERRLNYRLFGIDLKANSKSAVFLLVLISFDLGLSEGFNDRCTGHGRSILLVRRERSFGRLPDRTTECGVFGLWLLLRRFDVLVENAAQEAFWHVVEVYRDVALDVVQFLDLHLRCSHDMLRDKEANEFGISHRERILLHTQHTFDLLDIAQKLLDQLLGVSDPMEILSDFLDDVFENGDAFREIILEIAVIEYVNVFEQLNQFPARLLNVDRLGLVLLALSLFCLLSVHEGQLLELLCLLEELLALCLLVHFAVYVACSLSELFSGVFELLVDSGHRSTLEVTVNGSSILRLVIILRVISSQFGLLSVRDLDSILEWLLNNAATGGPCVLLHHRLEIFLLLEHIRVL